MPTGPDLSTWAICGIALVFFVTPLANALASSVTYLVLRRDRLRLARQIQSMGWAILGIQIVLWLGYATIRLVVALAA